MYPDMTMLPGGYVTVALSGDIDIVTAPVVRDALARAARQAVIGVIVDLDEVTFLDAAGLGVLVGANRRARHLPDGLRLVAVPARVLRLLTVTELDRHLAAFPAPPPGGWPEREPADPPGSPHQGFMDRSARFLRFIPGFLTDYFCTRPWLTVSAESILWGPGALEGERDARKTAIT